MFESAEVGNAVDKKTYAKRLERLRTDLLKAQDALTPVGAEALVDHTDLIGASCARQLCL